MVNALASDSFVRISLTSFVSHYSHAFMSKPSAVRPSQRERRLPQRRFFDILILSSLAVLSLVKKALRLGVRVDGIEATIFSVVVEFSDGSLWDIVAVKLLVVCMWSQ
jgi:hypothetical protein